MRVLAFLVHVECSGGWGSLCSVVLGCKHRSVGREIRMVIISHHKTTSLCDLQHLVCGIASLTGLPSFLHYSVCI